MSEPLPAADDAETPAHVQPAHVHAYARADQGPPPAAREVTIVADDVGDVGGMERVLAELAVGLQERGHEVTVIARTCILPDGCGVKFHRVRGPGRPLALAHPWFMIAGSLAVRRWRRGVVQATGAIVLNRVDVIAVHYCHQMGSVSPSSASLPFKVHALAANLVKRVTERMCYRPRNAAAFVCVSDGVANDMRRHYPRVANRVVTIHNGVDTASFAPGLHTKQARELRERLAIEPGSLVAAFVARSLWEHKGLAELLRALALSDGWELVVAGGGDRRRYQQLADSLGVGGSVHWLGITADIQPVYELADAFVLPSRYETFSLVSFEAAASGLPVIATPVNGVRELIEDGRNGFLVRRDPADIARCLDQLSADPARRAAMGHSAREAALRFSWQQTVNRHGDLYARIAAGVPARGETRGSL